MQTFLPYNDFQKSAKVLDNKRLGKQRVECKQILRALSGETKGWVNHPATRMWRGHEAALCEYAIAICTEWRSRGFNDSLLAYFQEALKNFPACDLPAWLNEGISASHRSNLLRKNAQYYSQFDWSEPADLPYVWPV
jgi:hypothetical protein